jgi:tRNA (guanine37-N1)-methyltransferase
MKEAHGIEVRLQLAQQTLKVLQELKLLETGLEFKRADKQLLMPLSRAPSVSEIERIRQQAPDATIQKATFTEHPNSAPGTLVESVRGKIPDNLLSQVPRSYDLIGDIAIVELPESVAEFSAIVGEAVLKLNPYLRLVLRKSGSVSGTFRTRRFDVISGSGSTETLHKEHGCTLHLDIAQVYFNPRLSHERMRVARQVRQQETVVDMFAGVGPYSILVAKMSQTSRVAAIEMNIDAFKYLKENVFKNVVADRVTPILGDAREVISRKLQGTATRVIMNLPSEAVNFLNAAAQAINADGGVIHYYTFASRSDDPSALKQSASRILRNCGRKVVSVPFCEAIREVAPSRVQVAIDFSVR